MGSSVRIDSLHGHATSLDRPRLGPPQQVKLAALEVGQPDRVAILVDHLDHNSSLTADCAVLKHDRPDIAYLWLACERSRAGELAVGRPQHHDANDIKQSEP